MFRLLSLAALAMLSTLTFAAPSQALSCLPPSPESSFARYHAASEVYQVWAGRWYKMQPTPNTGGYVDPINGTEPAPVVYQFRGRMVGGEGKFGPRRTLRVRVEPQCAGPWCADYPKNGDTIVGFFKVTGTGVRSFEPLPCGGAAFERNQGNINRIAACFTRGACS